MIFLSILGLTLGTAAQLVALFASSKFAFANGASVEVPETSVARTRSVVRSEAATVVEPAWANLMRGM